MKRYIVIGVILFASVFTLLAINFNSDETIYIKMQDTVQDHTEDNSSNEKMTEEWAAEKLFRYLEKQNHPSNNFELHLEEKEQEKDSYVMKAYNVVGEDDSQFKEKIGLYAVSKSTGEITSLN
ncbi:hypothetical protein [Sediminibacillus albus]|uniref:Uncharacterized protein n=1 Tax=Sediminibacillus albus TaxID=407036 RepID=A0A1G9D048_9BACI|nr:hypothetical protein [Sediminibacillus albus]SDK57272.1 hypothetical protein SAMN05216243_3590 [Sediminibacillus albus]